MKVSCLPPGAVVNLYTASGENVRKVFEVGGMATWDGKNNQGQDATAGIYYYRVTQESGFLIKGVLVIDGDR